MLLTDARRPARTRPDGALIPLAEQDRSLWDTAAITEGVDLITTTLATAAPGPYQVQAAIAAVLDEATRAEDTDWRQILGLYELLACLAPEPMVTLNRIVAVGMVRGPAVALEQLDAAESDPVLTVSTQSAHTCSTKRASTTPPASTTGGPPDTPSASPNSATSSPAPRHRDEHRNDGRTSTALAHVEPAPGQDVPGRRNPATPY
jgi:hypothetical protein